MSNLVDLTAWPLVNAGQNGRLTVQDATELADALRTTLDRAKAENRQFAIVMDQRERSAPEKGATEILHGFWAQHAEEIAAWCAGMASIVATPSLADLVQNPGPGGLAVLGTVDPDAAAAWARDRLALAEA
ncbi:hypothetical protein ACBI99_34565 [Nonomuraea sp. ATR24]|uniref:hypothetical protein n=1 Tax=Nonomuraea TaxID=83681 RepID=UPI001C5FF8DF|nr:hypothetical protein [Nonomuraea ceibae]